MAEFFAMGGYAVFVWPSFAVAAVVMVGLLVASMHTMRVNRAQLAALEANHPRRRRRGETGQEAGDDT